MNILRLVPKFADPDDVIKKYCRKYFKAPCSIELIHLPFVLFKYEINLISILGKSKSEKGLFLVDMLQGIPVNIKKNTKFEFTTPDLEPQFQNILDGLDPNQKYKTSVTIEPKEIDQEQILPKVLTEDEAIKRGKNLLMYDIMKITGSFRYRKIDIVPHLQTKILYYPHWLIYYRNKNNEILFDVIDGLTSQKEGGQIIKSIKTGLVKKHSPC